MEAALQRNQFENGEKKALHLRTKKGNELMHTEWQFGETAGCVVFSYLLQFALLDTLPLNFSQVSLAFSGGECCVCTRAFGTFCIG